MSSQPFMQLYVGDYLADTLHLSTEQHGAYLLLLMTMWRHDARLPNDPKKLARIARTTARKWPGIWEEISEFFEVDGEYITNARLTKEHQKATAKSTVRANAGSLGGKAKALKKNDQGLANATDLPKHGQKSEPDKVKREAKASPKKGTRLPADWRLSKALGEWAVSEGASVDQVRQEAEKFRDYWHSVAGAKGTKLDWDAVWRNWIRKALADQKPHFKAIQGGQNDKRPSKSEFKQNAFISGAAISS